MVEIEHMVIGAVAIVLLIAVFQTIQLTALNEKISGQEKILSSTLAKATLSAASGSQQINNTTSADVKTSTTSSSAPTPTMVGGC